MMRKIAAGLVILAMVAYLVPPVLLIIQGF